MTDTSTDTSVAPDRDAARPSSRIGFLGAGRMAQTLGGLFLRAGHRIVLTNSRGPDSLAATIAALGPGASAARPETLAGECDVIVLAVPWTRVPDALESLGDVHSAIVVDTTNNRIGPRPEDVVDLDGRGSSEIVAELAPSARVVKAFNHQPIPSLATLAEPGPPRALFLAGDDEGAKAVVAELIHSIGGVPLDTGRLVDGGRLQSTGGGPLAGHGRLLTVDEATAALRDARRRH